MDAESHLIEAANCIRRGEQEYAHAADEIMAAQREDPTLGYRTIAERVGKSREWCRALVQWRTNGIDEAGPFSEAAGKPNRDESGMRKVIREQPDVVVEAIREAPPEVQARIVDALPPADRLYRMRHGDPVAPPEGTAAEYLRDPAPDPSDYEMDHLVLQGARIAREIRSRIDRYGVRTMGTPQDTLRDLDSMISDAAEARAAVQEFVNESALT